MYLKIWSLTDLIILDTFRKSMEYKIIIRVLHRSKFY